MKTIKTRIKSVQNTKKITKAMEMVSAAKMRKAVEATMAARVYAELSRELLEHLAHIDEPNVPLLEERPVKKVLLVIITSNRGLCGSFNSSVMKAGREYIKHVGEGVQVDVLGIGKKSAIFAKRHNLDYVAAFDSISDTPDFEEILPVNELLMNKFLDKSYDRVVMLYTKFKSAISQEVLAKQLLPLSKETILELSQQTTVEEEKAQEEKDFEIESYLFEPGLEEIVNYVMPRLVEIALFEAVLESSASEHSSRMVAMKNASEAAGDMISNLKLTFNKARQAAITQEIAEIAGGAAALG